MNHVHSIGFEEFQPTEVEKILSMEQTQNNVIKRRDVFQYNLQMKVNMGFISIRN